MNEHRCRPKLKAFLLENPFANWTCEICGTDIEPNHWQIYVALRVVLFLLWLDVRVSLQNAELLQFENRVLLFGARLLIEICSALPSVMIGYAAYRLWYALGWYKKIEEIDAQEDES